jgi:hypothetical protein
VTNYYELSVNNTILEDSLLSGSSFNLPAVGYVEQTAGNNNRLQLKELSTGTTVLDTMISLSGRTTISFLQLSADSKPFITGGNDDGTTLPLNDSVKVRFIYTSSELPDSIYLKMYYTRDYVSLVPVEHSRFSFPRNTFSRYFTLANYNGTENVYGFEMYNAQNDALIQKIELDPAQDGFFDGFLVNTYLGIAGELESYLLVKDISYTSPIAPNYMHYAEQYLYSQK